MGKPQRRRKRTNKNKHLHKAHFKSRNQPKDFDQLHADIKPTNAGKFMNPDIDEDLPGFGQYYCISCGRHFISKNAIVAHNKTKFHKRMLKKLKTEKPYTDKDAYEFGKF